MATTKSKNSYKTNRNNSTDDNTVSRKGTFDFSDGKFSLTLSIGQILLSIGFVFMAGWSLATIWFFQVQTEKLKAEFRSLLNENKEFFMKSGAEKDIKINTLENKLNDATKKIEDLKNKNLYLK